MQSYRYEEVIETLDDIDESCYFLNLCKYFSTKDCI